MDQENRINTEKSLHMPLSWGAADDAKPGAAPKGVRSHGLIDARACHGTPRAGQEFLRELKTGIRDRSIQMKKSRIKSAQDTKLQAFKLVTVCKTWPVQEQALQHRRELMSVYLDGGNVQPQANNKGSKVSLLPLDVGVASVAGSSSSSSSSSAMSAGEPKRRQCDPLLSPNQSRIRCLYQREFLQELHLAPQPYPGPVALAPALWGLEPRLFSRERSATGRRSYVAAHLGRFADRYWRRTDPAARHYYEVIPEHTPCRLYFDLEFGRAANLRLADDAGAAEALLTELFAELQAELEAIFQLQLERSHVVDLDSSTETKFSRHWIVHLPGDVLFPDNIAAGAFVRNLVSRLSNEQATRQLEAKGHRHLQRFLFVNTSNKNGDQATCLIDLGVYTRNRLFRLLGSQKFGKPPSAALRIAEANTFPFPDGFSNELFYLPAMQATSGTSAKEQPSDTDGSFDFGDSLDRAVEAFRGQTDWSLHAEALAMTLIVPMNASKVMYPLLECPKVPISEKPTSGFAGRFSRTSSTMSSGASPYSVVDDFVTNVLAMRGDVPGCIRAWFVDRSENGAARQITYQMSRNRYCECIGRSHKSNNISWTVDFQSMHCVQGCHDPDCRRMNFRGTPVELPDDVKDALLELLFEEELARVDESELLRCKTESDTRENLDAQAGSSFENALARLKLDEQTQNQLSFSGAANESQPTLSDDLLIEAMVTNPELFP